MKIAVLVKQVPDHEAIIRIDSENSLDIEDRYVCSFFDEIAIEAALNLKSKHSESEITAFSAGGKKAVDALRRALSMGVDSVIHLGDDGLNEADDQFKAEVLSNKIQEYSPDIILCGKQAGDDDMAAVGPMVAEFLDIPHVSAAVSLEPLSDSSKVQIGRSLEGEVWTLEAKLPVLISAEKGLAEPHVPAVTKVMKAMKTKIENISLTDLGLEQGERLLARKRFVGPPVRPEVKMFDDPFPDNVTQLIGCLQEKGLLTKVED